MKDILSWQVNKPDSRRLIETNERPTEYATHFKNYSPSKESHEEDNLSYRANRFNEFRRKPDEAYYDSKVNESLGKIEFEPQNQKQTKEQIKDFTAKDIKEMQRKRSPDLFEEPGAKKQTGRSRITFPSQQKYEDNLNEIEALHQKLTELGAQKQIVLI